MDSDHLGIKLSCCGSFLSFQSCNQNHFQHVVQADNPVLPTSNYYSYAVLLLKDVFLYGQNAQFWLLQLTADFLLYITCMPSIICSVWKKYIQINVPYNLRKKSVITWKIENVPYHLKKYNFNMRLVLKSER